MGESRATRTFADRPDAGRGRPQLVVDLDGAALGEFDAGELEPNARQCSGHAPPRPGCGSPS